MTPSNTPETKPGASRRTHPTLILAAGTLLAAVSSSLGVIIVARFIQG
ncbi:MAG: hypothetical protein QOG40_605, partial [Solirubrobacteraceae bacterium]|nr:hypothetical protein [Solirubrobacteraceae bacterium]